MSINVPSSSWRHRELRRLPADGPVVIKMLLGLMLVGNAVNILILVVSGNSGNPPIRGRRRRAADADPLAQAMILTAIVIMMGVAAFVLALVLPPSTSSTVTRARTTTTSTTIPRT